MTEMSFPDVGQAAPVACADPQARWAPPEAPLAMPMQVLEHPRMPVRAYLAAVLRGPRRPGGAVG